jgi:hypothetical protein
MESLLVEAEVLSRETRITAESTITFDPTVGTRSNIYSSIRRPVSLDYLWNPYSLKRRYCRARTE